MLARVAVFSLAVLATFVGVGARAEAPIPNVTVTASSALPPWKGYTFDAGNLVDGRVDTSWQPAKNDTYGVGQWFELDLGATYEVTAIDLDNGLQATDPKLGDLFCRNNRMDRAIALFDDGTATYLGFLANDRHLQFRAGRIVSQDQEKPFVVTRHIRVVIAEAQQPVDWEDLAVAEIHVYGTKVAAPAPPPPTEPAACATPAFAPFVHAVSDFCLLPKKGREAADCRELMAAMTECSCFIEFEEDYQTSGPPTGPPVDEPLAPIPAADLAAGAFDYHFKGQDRVQHTLHFARGADGAWRVARHTRLDEDGKPTRPRYETLISGGMNACWDILGKKRTPYP